MFSQASVILFTRGGVGGGGVADTPHWADAPPRQTSPWADTPMGRHPQADAPWTDTPLADTPQWADTPWASPGDGCRSRRYASYWNEFLLIGIISYFSYLSFTYQSSKYVMQCLRNLFHYFLHRMAKVK